MRFSKQGVCMSKRAVVVALVALATAVLAIGACEDSSSGSAGSFSLDGGGSFDIDAGQSTVDAATTPDSGATASLAPGIYVANGTTNAITVYPLGAGGNVAPLRTIVGASTGLSTPIGMVVDS